MPQPILDDLAELNPDAILADGLACHEIIHPHMRQR
jgi:hypothetical protein